MALISNCLSAIAHLFTNEYMFSLLGLLALAIIVYAFKILINH